MGGISGKSRGVNGVGCASNLIKCTNVKMEITKIFIERVTGKLLSSLSVFKFQ